MYRTLQTPASLRGLVDALWRYDGVGEAHRVLPDGCSDLLFDLGRGTASVVGAMTRAELVTIPEGEAVFGVRFLPGQAARFIDADLRDLTDAGASLEQVTRLASLGEAVADAKNEGDRSALVSRALSEARARVRPADPRVESTIAALQRSHGLASLRSLSLAAGLSERQLERRFLERVGLGPKRFARITRFAHALEIASACNAHAELAARAGYSDEPHLQREFRALSGLTPRALLRERRVGFVQGRARDSA